MRARHRRTPRPVWIPLGVREDDPAVEDDVRGTAHAGRRTQVGSGAVAGARTPTRTPTTLISGRCAGVRACRRIALTCADRTRVDASKRRSATWGSSGRRFESCQPDSRKGSLACDDAIVTELNGSKLGNHLGTTSAERAVREGLPVGVQVTLGSSSGCRGRRSFEGCVLVRRRRPSRSTPYAVSRDASGARTPGR